MIQEYHRPHSLENAIDLLGRVDLPMLPLGGGTVLSKMADFDFGVVDLQGIESLNRIRENQGIIEIGSAVKLQQLFEYPGLNAVIRHCLWKETSLNIRNSATIAGSLACADGKSSLATILLALDAALVWAPGEVTIRLGDWLPERKTWKKARLITSIHFENHANIQYECISRTPADFQQIGVASCAWKSGRTRFILAGEEIGQQVISDGGDSHGVFAAAQTIIDNLFPEKMSKDYISTVVSELIRRQISH